MLSLARSQLEMQPWYNVWVQEDHLLTRGTEEMWMWH